MKRFLVLAVAGLLGTTLFAANKPVTVSLKDGAGKDVGTAKIADGAGGKGVKIALNLKGLPAGEHAVHIHAAAKCEGPGFTTAGGHFNPDSKKHGLMSPDGHHAGDMPNFTVKPNGMAKVNVTNGDVTLGTGANSLFTNGGTALMIHEKADDLKTDPTGNAGNRIACGTIAK